MGKITLEQVLAAKKQARAELAGFDPPPAIGVTRVKGQYALKVNLLEALPAGVKVPRSVAGVPVKVEIVGKVSKLAEATAGHRPRRKQGGRD